MPDSSERLLGKIEAGIDAIRSTQTDMHEEFSAFRTNDMKSRLSIEKSLGAQTASIKTLAGEFSAHIKDDNRRFSLLFKIILGGSAGGAGVLGILKIAGVV